MNSLNKLMHRSRFAGSILAVLLIGGNFGCQSRQTSWLGAQNSRKPDLTRKQLSVSQLPNAMAQTNPTVPAPATSSGPTVARPPVQTASANSLRTPAAPAEEIQHAIYLPQSGATQSKVVHAQHTLTPNRYPAIRPASGSENVPRIAMAAPAMSMPNASQPTPSQTTPNQPTPNQLTPNQPTPNVPRSQLAGNVRTQGHVHTGANCSCNHGTGAYKPMFPRLSGNQGCSVCGTATCHGECGGAMIEQGFAVPRASDPQEYIFDGGDQDPQVRLKTDLTQVGLDPEDTVIQYETMDGKTKVESGCRVAIYAPRFASVRKRQSTRESELAMRLRTTERPNGPGVIREQLPSAKVTQPLKLMNSDSVRVVEAFRDRNRPLPSDLTLPMVTVSDAFKPFEDLSLIRNGDLKRTDLAKLAKSAAAARTWTNVDELNVLIDGQEALEVVADQRAADVTIYEHKGARIRLCKVASEQMANPGDVISFTIRFDNVGEQTLSNLVVTDSLAPRLEYVEKSQLASVPVNFSMAPNIAGSSVLRWELEKGLKPGEGGLVRFSCKVR